MNTEQMRADTIKLFESFIDSGPDCFNLKAGDCAYWIKKSEVLKFAEAIASRAPAVAAVPDGKTAIIPDWPFCNPACDYEDPHGFPRDERTANCSCEAAKASIAHQLAAAPATASALAEKCRMCNGHGLVGCMTPEGGESYPCPECDARAAADGAGELPALPLPSGHDCAWKPSRPFYTADQMRDYARAAQPTAAADSEDAALTDDQIIEVWQSMPGGPDGWLKGFGYLQFARAVLDAARSTKESKHGN